MHRKKGDWSDRVVYALLGVLGIVLVIHAYVLVLAVPEPSLMPLTARQASGTVSFRIIGTCSGPIVEGWNLISLCANVSNPNITEVLSGIDFRYVMRWNESSQNFQIFSPSAASNPFTVFEINRSYFVYLNSVSGSIEPNSNANPDLDIALTTGWTSPALPYEFTANFTRYFNNSVHRYHMKWNSTTQKFVIYSPRMASPPPSLMFVGDGQFIYSEVANTLSYNRTDLTI